MACLLVKEDKAEQNLGTQPNLSQPKLYSGWNLNSDSVSSLAVRASSEFELKLSRSISCRDWASWIHSWLVRVASLDWSSSSSSLAHPYHVGIGLVEYTADLSELHPLVGQILQFQSRFKFWFNKYLLWLTTCLMQPSFCKVWTGTLCNCDAKKLGFL